MTTKSTSRWTLRSALLKSAALLAVASVAPSCTIPGDSIDDHWNLSSVPPRVARAVLGYDATKESSYRDFAWDRKQSIELTIRRMFLNHNPMNPNQPAAESIHGPRPVNSILPNPWNYIHVEGFLIGFATLGVPVPIPVDSIIGTIEKGGVDEFTDGLSQGFSWRGDRAAGGYEDLYDEDGSVPPFQMTDKAR